MSADDIRAGLLKTQAILRGLLSHTQLALDALDVPAPEPDPEPTPEPEPRPGPVPDPTPAPTLRDVGKVNLTANGQVLSGVNAEHVGFVTCDGASLRDFRAGSLVVSSAQNVTIERGDVVGRLGADGLHITSDRGSLVRNVAVRDVSIGSPKVTESSHYDGIQVRGVDGLTLERVRIDLGPHKPQYTAALFLQDAQGGCHNVTARDCTFLGGGYTLYLFGQNVVLEDCIVGGDGYGLLYPKSIISTVTLRNVRDDQGRLLKFAGSDGACALVPA